MVDNGLLLTSVLPSAPSFSIPPLCLEFQVFGGFFRSLMGHHEIVHIFLLCVLGESPGPLGLTPDAETYCTGGYTLLCRQKSLSKEMIFFFITWDCQ